MSVLDFKKFLGDFTVDDLLYLYEIEFSNEQLITCLLNQDKRLRKKSLQKRTTTELMWLIKKKITKEKLIDSLAALDKTFQQKLMQEEEAYYVEAKSRLILKKFWTEEELEEYKILGYRKFSKWGIANNEALLQLASNCLLFEVGYEKKNNHKYYFHEDFYLAQMIKNKRILLGIGRDPDKRTHFLVNEE